MNKFCPNCGKENAEGAVYCAGCGAPLAQQAPQGQPMMQQPVAGSEAKSKLAAGLFGLFLGSFGVHNFYLGFTGKAVAQLLLTLVGWILCGIGPLVAAIWGLIEGILIFTGSINVDAKGMPLKD